MTDELHIEYEDTPRTWCAYYDPEGLIGRGKREVDAVADLLEQTDEAWRKALDERDTARRGISEAQYTINANAFAAVQMAEERDLWRRAAENKDFALMAAAQEVAKSNGALSEAPSSGAGLEPPDTSSSTPPHPRNELGGDGKLTTDGNPITSGSKSPRSFSDFIRNAEGDERREVFERVIDGAIERQKGSALMVLHPRSWVGKPCEVCGRPVYPPTTIHQRAAAILNERVWHGECFPPGGVSGTFTVPSSFNVQEKT